MFKKDGRSKRIAVMGVLLLLVAGITAGCSSQQASSGGTQSQTDQTLSNTQNTDGQTNQGRAQMNPAARAAMEVSRLQRNTQTAFTSDQINQLKPLLQALIDTSNPSSDFLQTKADAITAIFTEQQKTALAQKPSGNNRPQGAGTTPNSPSSSSSNSGTAPANNGSSDNSKPNKGNAPSHNFDPKTIYQQALDALNK